MHYVIEVDKWQEQVVGILRKRAEKQVYWMNHGSIPCEQAIARSVNSELSTLADEIENAKLIQLTAHKEG
jgi:hypothetical protein